MIKKVNIVYLLVMVLPPIAIIVSSFLNKDTMISKEQYIHVENHTKLWVETYGDNKQNPCLLISGAGANSSFWSESLCKTLVNQGFYVIKYDHRDFGYSTKINSEEQPYDFNRLVNDAVTILDSLQVDKVHAVGHSMGGFIVQLLGIHHPSRVLSMSSISSSTSSPLVPLPPDKTWEIYLANKPNNDFDSDLDGFLKVWEYLNGTASFDRELAVEYTKALYERQDIDGALGASHVKAQATLTDRTQALKQVNIPTLVMHGEEDYAVDKYGAIQTAESIKNAELIIIPQMGHIPFNKALVQRFEDEIIKFVLRNKR